MDYGAQERHTSANVRRSWFGEWILGADSPVPLRRFPVYHLPVMLAQHLHAVVGFSEPTATLPATRR